jgi:hypothetical protein
MSVTSLVNGDTQSLMSMWTSAIMQRSIHPPTCCSKHQPSISYGSSIIALSPPFMLLPAKLCYDLAPVTLET